MRKLALACALLAPSAAAAQVARLELTGPPQPILDGREFGAGGRYERITARATIAVDPVDPRNAVIADIAAAPRNAQGRVEAVADVVILRPADPARGNGTLLLEVPNRGRKLALPLFNESPIAAGDREAGNGFLFRQGYTLAWVGWQADFTPAAGQLGIQVPVLAGVTGTVREEVVFDHTRSPAAMPLAYAAAGPADPRLTVRARWDLPRQTPADLAFRFIDPRRVEVSRPAGFDAGALYELTYAARDPMVLGLGFAAVRDVASFLRHERGAANPLAGRVRRGLGFGVSQSGRFLRDYLHLGFNEDTDGRPVFDGLMPHVAGSRRMFMNSRFARPDKAPRHPQDPAWPADAFPFAYADTVNPFTGERDGLLRRCRLSSTCPKVMQTDTEYEWWGAHASLLVTDPRGMHLDLPPDVRAYMVSGTPHFAEPGAQTARNAVCALPTNSTHAGAPMRALLGHLDAWVRGEAARRPPAACRTARAARWWRRSGPCRWGCPACPSPACTCRRRSPTTAWCRRGSSAASRCSCRGRTPTAWPSPASACRWWRRRAPPTPPGTRAPRAMAARG
jgi:Alpha/beta hydrolase domain